MTPALDSVLLGLMRRAAPAMLAQQLASVQPMTGSAGNVFISSLNGTRGCDGNLAEIWASDAFIVDFDKNHPIQRVSRDAVTWAVLNCRAPFNYYTPAITSHLGTPPGLSAKAKSLGMRLPDTMQTRVWRWAFTDENDAFAFKMRWV